MGVYLSLGGLLFLVQGSMIFPAPGTDRGVIDATAMSVGAQTVILTAEDGTQLYTWHRAASGKRAVIFFHGNAERVHDRLELHAALLQADYDVIITAYRGYPGSEGSPSEWGLAQDARATWSFVTETLQIPAGQVVLHGKSLGGGVASRLAAEVDPAALVLESTFTSIPDVAGPDFWFYPVRTLLRHRFETALRAPEIDCPVLVLHGDADGVIGVEHGRALHEAFAGSEYVEVAGAGHGETLVVRDAAAGRAYFGLLAAVAGR